MSCAGLADDGRSRELCDPVWQILMRLLLIFAAFCAVCSRTGALAVQQANDPPATVVPEASSPRVPTAGNATSDLLLKRPDGSLVPVDQLLAPEAIQQILRRSTEQTDIPLFDLSRLDATMSVAGNIVTISADLTVTVRVDREWVAVPVGFDEVHLTGFAHDGPSDDAQAVPDVSRPPRKLWHLYGGGIHHIHLDLITTTRPTSSGGQQLILSLPEATQSRVDVSFSNAVDLQQLTSESVSQRKTNEAGVVGVQFWGPDRAFNMTWSEIVKAVAAPPAIQVQNRMQLDLTTIPILLSGNQQIQISAAPVDQLQITLPADFKLLELDVRNQAGVSILNQLQTTDQANGQTLDISLTTASEGQLSVVWDAELLAASFPRDVLIQLPRVTGASVQTGDLDILIPPGLLVTQEEVSGAQRKRVAAESDGQIAATAFRVRSPESRIRLQVDEIEALYAVSPELILQPDAQNALLTVRLQLNVLRGSLLDLGFRWPGFDAGSWQLLPRSARLLTAGSSSQLSLEKNPDDPDSFSLQFPERQSGQFTVELKAFAPLDQLPTESAVLICPEVDSDTTQPAVVTTVESDSFTLLPLNAATGEPLDVLPDRSTIERSSVQERSSTSWLLDRLTEPIRFHVNSQAPSVTTAVAIELSPQEYGIEVRQDIAYRIEHRDLTQLSLAFPEGIRAVVHLEGEVEPLRGTVEAGDIRTYRLPQPQRGDLNLVIQYLWPLPGSTMNQDQASISLPIVLPQQTDVSLIEVGTSTVGSLRVRDNATWQPVYSQRFGTAWSSEEPVREIELTWNHGAPLHPPGMPVAVLARTLVIEQSVLTTTTALFEELPTAFTFVLPGSMALQDVVVNGSSVRDGLRAERIAGSTDVRWTVFSQPDSPPAAADSDSEAATEATITLKTRQQVPEKASWLEQITIQRPRFSTELVDIPVIQWVESPDAVQMIPVDDTFLQLSKAPMLPLLQQRSATAVQKIEALSSTLRSGLQSVILDHAEAETDNGTAVFFSDSDSNRVSLYLLPAVPLLLISAVVCLLSFLLLVLIPRIRMTAYVIVLGVLMLLSFSLAPEWAFIVAPYVIVGTLFGLVAVLFQRMTGDRQSRLLRSPHPQDIPTVFGFTEFLRPGSTAGSVPSSAAAQPSRDVTASAARG
jgi:hypothetical protein